MNKNLIALAVAAVSVSGAASAAEVYSDETSSLAVGGRFEARAVMADTDTDDNKVSDKTRVRINVAGKTDITDNLYGIGFFERQFNSDGEDDETRYAYAGMGGSFGELVYGKADGALGMLTDFTDIMQYHGNGAGNKLDAADRTENNLSYVGSFDIMGDNLTVKANYVFDDGENKDGYAASAMYVMDMGLGFGLGYGEQDGQSSKEGNEDETGEQLFGAISYTIGDFYFAGLYQDAENTVVHGELVKESEGYEFAASYTLGKTVFIATYNYLENTDKNIDLTDAISVDATHYFNKNFRTYMSYKFNNLDIDTANGISKADTSDEFVIGARYDF